MGLKEEIAKRNRKLKNTATLGKQAPPKAGAPAMSAKDKAIHERIKMFRAGKNPDAKPKIINKVKRYTPRNK